MDKNPENLNKNKDFVAAKSFLEKLSVTNDSAERMVASFKEYNESITVNEE